MKTFKKVLASTLAAAMVVTAFPVTNAEAASTAKLSTTKATIYVGGSKTLSVKTPSNWKNVKVTATSSKKSVAKISKVSGKKVTVKAVKKGTAKVTVKVTAKKAGKKVSKTLKATVAVKNPSITLNQSKVTLNIGETTPVNVTKKTPSSITVKYTSEDPAIASVSKGTITAISAGTTNIVVTAKYGTKTFTKKIAVTVKATKDGLTSTLTNAFSSEYENTVLVNDTAIVNVVYAKDGKPVSGETVVMSCTDGVGNSINPSSYANYSVKGNNVAVTNASGVATFVIANNNNVKASATNQVASVNYKVQVPDSNVVSEGTVNFAAISNAKISDVNNHNTITSDNLVPGTNYAGSTNGCATTTSMDQATVVPMPKNVEYVESQQVSSTGNNEHEVTMTGGYPMIYLPGSSSTVENATKMTDEINQSSKKYNTYANDSYYYELKEDPNKLTYATLNFDKVTLSAYTRLVIETFANKKAAEDSKNPGVSGNGAIDQKVYDGEMVQSNLGYQIPLGSGYAKLCVKVTLQAAGQVDMSKNDGYTVKNVVYVYKTQKTTAGTATPLKNATVEWSIAATPYTAETAVASVNGVSVAPGEKLTAKLPVFPYTGTAVITKYDSNNKVVAYYAVATCNNGKNQNEIDTTHVAYQISSDELRDKVGEIVSQNGTSVTVDSKQSGRMTLEGTVKVDGKVLDDAELASVYTSVQWNPIPKTDATDSDAFVALIGQKIEVVAQLTDKNGNAVSESGHGITFKSTKLGTRDNRNTPDSVTADTGKVTIVNQVAAKTDANGQSKMILKASDIAELLKVKAESADSQYDAKLVIAGKSTDSADLYWVDANLYFKDKVQAGFKDVTTSATTPVAVTTGFDIQPDAGSTWMYGVQVVGTKAIDGKLKDKNIVINGLGVTMSKNSSSVGTIESLADVKGAVKATSTKGGNMDIISKIDSTTLTKDVTVSEGTYAGTGATSINKKLTISVTWKAASLTASYVNPTGTRTTASSKDVYLKVTDSYGNAVSGSAVTFKTDDGQTATDTTDANGIAKATVTKGAASTTTVSATVAGISADTFDQTIVWVNSVGVKTLAIDRGTNVDDAFVTNYDKDKKTVTLTFNDDIVASSVVKELFTVTYDGQTADNQLVVKSVAVNDNVVTLTLSDVPSLVDARDTVKVAVQSDTVKSVKYVLTSLAGSSYDNKTVTISLDGKTNPVD